MIRLQYFRADGSLHSERTAPDHAYTTGDQEVVHGAGVRRVLVFYDDGTMKVLTPLPYPDEEL